MVVLSTGVNFQFTVHSATQRTTWQHAFNSFFDDHFRLSSLKFLEVSRLKTTWEASVSVVHFVLCLVTGYSNFFGIDYDDVVTGINVRSVLSFMLTAQATSNLSSDATQSFTFGVNYVPVTFYSFWLSNKRFHF